MVQNTYKVTLVSCIVPLAAGIFWPRATAQGALASIALGLSSWIGIEIYAPTACCRRSSSGSPSRSPG